MNPSHMFQNVPLAAHSTMRLGGNASYLVEITERNELAEAITWADEQNLPIVMIGEGSNIVWTDGGFPGLVIVNKVQGIEIMGEGAEQQYVTAGAGMNWDSFVAHTTERGLTGIEFLSLIPGTVGATPVQNVGAYGQEVADTIATLEAYDRSEKRFITMPAFECNFGYRMSRFKSTDRNRFFITRVTFSLRAGSPTPPYYSAVEQYRVDHGIASFTPQAGRQAVIDIRSAKLPDPKTVANNGSFFANPIIAAADKPQLLADHPNLAYWEIDDEHVKLSAAWLIEQAGFKDFHDPETGMGTWPTQPLVLVNESAKRTADLLIFKQKIVDAVTQKFGVTLEQEPELIGS